SQKNLLQNLDAILKFNSIQVLQNQIQYHFKDKERLINALTQSTFCYEFKDLSLSSNERLEFLGDSLVNFIVAKMLFKRFPKAHEGDLSKLRGSLVNEQSLSKLAESISLGENLLLGKGEHKNKGKKKESLLADAFEALCAAIYLDSSEDIQALEKSILAIVEQYVAKSGKEFFAIENLAQFDSKTQLQELSMAMFGIHPSYKAMELKTGFSVELWIGERKLAEASGPSKKKLEKELARIVLDEKRYQ
ncbi:MAG: ribonuclease III, partial [Bacteriovorax sp.]